jgi:hypothetical protein
MSCGLKHLRINGFQQPVAPNKEINYSLESEGKREMMMVMLATSKRSIFFFS